MTISEWLEKNGLTHEQFALMAGCDRSSVTKWATGERFPSPRWMKVILKITKGQVYVTKDAEFSYRDFIRLALYKQGLTISDAAKQMGIHRNTLSRFLLGQVRTNPDIVQSVRKLSGVR
jgi:transcriptional regulator with XRE-family HTH domain